jgi:hypothetical protein
MMMTTIVFPGKILLFLTLTLTARRARARASKKDSAWHRWLVVAVMPWKSSARHQRIGSQH